MERSNRIRMLTSAIVPLLYLLYFNVLSGANEPETVVVVAVVRANCYASLQFVFRLETEQLLARLLHQFAICVPATAAFEAVRARRSAATTLFLWKLPLFPD